MSKQWQWCNINSINQPKLAMYQLNGESNQPGVSVAGYGYISVSAAQIISICRNGVMSAASNLNINGIWRISNGGVAAWRTRPKS